MYKRETTILFKHFDIHSHLNFSQFDDEREDIIEQMRGEGIGTICVGTGLQTSKESIALAQEHEHIFATVGVHPTDWEEGFDENIFTPLLGERVVGVGECGLDYYRDDSHKKEQKELFEAQIAFAQQHSLPLMLHGRPKAGSMDAYEDMLEILEGNEVRGHVHFFAGNIDIAKQFVDRGFTIGFDGPITFTQEYDEVIRYIPLDMLCVETDAPFAAPEPYRGRRNSPLYVKHVLERVAEVRSESYEEIREATVENALRVFDIEK
ncbi:MAG: TatD family hydrolase [Candidatus Paceibacterota bacterium]